MTVLAVLTLLAIFLVVYHHVGHPMVQALVVRLRPAPPRPSDAQIAALDPTQLPRIVMVIPAYNEAAHITEKLETLCGLDYPPDRLHIIVICDGCTDNTAQLAQATLSADGTLGGFSIDIRVHTGNQGKLARLNAALPALQDFDLVALTDVSALLSVDCLRVAAAWFEQPKVGGVMGRYELQAAGGAGQAAYWAYQVAVKEREDKMGSTLGAHGAFYVFRQKLFQPLAAGTINDDFVLPMAIVAQGYTMRYDPRIIAIEKEEVGDRAEGARRRRIAAGNVQQAILLWRLVHPRFGWVAYNFLFGKVLRAFCPALLILALVGSSILAPVSVLFALAALGQLMGYALVLWQHVLPTKPGGKLLEALHYIVMGHVAGLQGMWTYLNPWASNVRWNAP